MASIRPSELAERHWPPEVIENIKRYQERLGHADIAMTAVATEQPEAAEGLATIGNLSTFNESQSD